MIIWNLEFVGIVASMPYIINGFITSIGVAGRKPIKKFSEIRDGILVPPERSYVSTLYFEIERLFKVSERGLVCIVWLLGVIFGVISLTIVQVV